jgi:hypothetical protein
MRFQAAWIALPDGLWIWRWATLPQAIAPPCILCEAPRTSSVILPRSAPELLSFLDQEQARKSTWWSTARRRKHQRRPQDLQQRQRHLRHPAGRVLTPGRRRPERLTPKVAHEPSDEFSGKLDRYGSMPRSWTSGHAASFSAIQVVTFSTKETPSRRNAHRDMPAFSGLTGEKTKTCGL